MNLRLAIKTLFILFMTIGSAAAVEDLDQKLESYIREFHLRPLDYPKAAPRALVSLGARLFFDKKLSGNMNISCASCHDLKYGSGDGLPLALGEGMEGIHEERRQGKAPLLARHSPHLINIGFEEQTEMFWDGRVSFHKENHTFQTPLEVLNGPHPKLSHVTRILTHATSAQALFPLLEADEMLGNRGENELADLENPEDIWQGLVERLIYGPQASQYQAAFEKAYPQLKGHEATIAHVGEAIGAYLRHGMLVVNTPWDKYLRGDKSALSEKSKRGALVFMEQGRCVHCHNGPHLTNFEYRNIAIPPIGPGKTADGQDEGRAAVTDQLSDRYKFRVPALRNVAMTAPYMHNGAFLTLEEVVDHYDHVRHNFMHYQTTILMKEYGSLYNQRIERVFERERVIEMFNQLDSEVWPPLFLNEKDKSDLLDFLKVGLTGPSLEFYKPW